MRQTGLGAVLDRPSVPRSQNTSHPCHHSDPPVTVPSGHDPPKCGNTLKRLLLLTVLSTDMGVHDDFMNNFNKLMSRTRGQLVDSPDDFDTRVLVCQALIKCTDISNPVSNSLTITEIYLLNVTRRLAHTQCRNIGLLLFLANGRHKCCWRNTFSFLQPYTLH